MACNFRTLVAFASLLAGFTYYLCWRWLQLPLQDFSEGCFPSFVFVFAFGLLLPKLPTRLQAPYQSQWLLLALLTEPLFGTATLLDGIAAVLGYLSAQAIQTRLPTPSQRNKPNPLLFALAPLLLAGSYYPNYNNGSNGTPVYMSYDELRDAVAVEEPRAMSEMGRLVLYQDHLFINERNKGLHVIDNADPSAPQAIGFINIPGNTDVSIRDGYLYADSFIDLVVIDIRDPAQVMEVNRQIDVFPWDKYQVDQAKIGWFEADSSLGVVIDVHWSVY